MVNSNAHPDDESIHNMMGDYSHVGDESIQGVDENAIDLDNIGDLLQGPNQRNTENHQESGSHQQDSITDEQLIDSFPFANLNGQERYGNSHIDDETNRFLRPFGTNPQKDEDSFSAVMKQWNEERETQERKKNETTITAQEVINDERKTVGLYHNVPGDFAETLIFYDPFTFNTIVDEYMEAILSNIDNRSIDEWLEILKRFNEYHKDDSLIPRSHRVFLKKLEDGPFDYMTQSDWELLVKVEAFMYYEWSVYPDVRSITVPINEENDEYYENFRVYVIGIGWAIGGCILDTAFQPLYPVYFNETIFQTLIAITGLIWAFLPKISIPLTRKKKFSLNSGRPWSFREQMLATLTMSGSLRYPYAQDVIIALSNKYYLHQQGADNFGFILLLSISSQFMGFAVAGLLRAFLVYPSKMVYFDSLYCNSLSRALVVIEPREKVNGWILKRWEFFYLFMFIFFGWFWVVNIAFTALSDFDWPTWIAPNNVNLNAMTGTNGGLGIFPISTFDLSIIQFTSLYIPWNALWQYSAGFFVTTIAAIIIWYTNTANTAYFPINITRPYDNTGNFYNISRVLNPDNSLNHKEYENYSMIYFGATALVARGTLYMYYPAQIVSCALNYWRDFLYSCKSIISSFSMKKNATVLDAFEDRFSRTARNYPEVPDWWFIVILVTSFGIAIAVVEHWSFVNTPVYSIVLSCAIAAAFIYPKETLRARSSFDFGIDWLLMLINGIIFEANPIGIMMSNVYGNAFSTQIDSYVDNLKIGHYAGLAPRALFRCQALSLLLCTFVQAGLVQWQASMKIDPEFCSLSPQNKTMLTCISTESNYHHALYLAAISPKRLFYDYPYLKWTFLIGALYPLPLWICRQNISWMKSVRCLSKIIDSDILVILDEMVWLNSGMEWLPWSSWQFVGSNLLVGIIWQKWIRPNYPHWFSKYTYLFYSATLVANSFAQLIYVMIEMHSNTFIVSWWGNNVNQDTLDTLAISSLFKIPDKGYIGPEKGDFPIKVDIKRED